MRSWLKHFLADMGTYMFWGVLLLPRFRKQREKRIIKCFPTMSHRTHKPAAGGVWEITHERKGMDGKSLVVQTPAGPWFIDSVASNCSKPHDIAHRCWPRGGSVEDGTLSVQKKFGLTCDAGAGSVRIDAYHARLLRGHLIQVPF